MIEKDSMDLTYANLLIKRIRRMIDGSEFEHKDFTDEDLMTIALNVLRIMTEFIFGDGTEDVHEWQYFFDAQKSEKNFMFFLHHLERMSLVKNELLNEIMTKSETEDLEKLIKEFKGDDE